MSRVFLVIIATLTFTLSAHAESDSQAALEQMQKLVGSWRYQNEETGDIETIKIEVNGPEAILTNEIDTMVGPREFKTRIVFGADSVSACNLPECSTKLMLNVTAAARDGVEFTYDQAGYTTRISYSLNVDGQLIRNTAKGPSAKNLAPMRVVPFNRQ